MMNTRKMIATAIIVIFFAVALSVIVGNLSNIDLKTIIVMTGIMVVFFFGLTAIDWYVKRKENTSRLVYVLLIVAVAGLISVLLVVLL